MAGMRPYGPLAELPAGHWAYRSLEELMRAGLVVEFAPGTFDADRTITRYEAALLLVDAFRRAGAITSAPTGPNSLRTLLPDRLVASAAKDAKAREKLVEIVKALGRELAGELEVLGFAMQGIPAGAGPSTSGAAVEIRSGASVSVRSSSGAGTKQDVPGSTASSDEADRPPAGPGPQTGPSGRVNVSGLSVALSSLYELGLRIAVPGRWDVDGQVDLGTLAPTQLGLLVSSPDPDRWVWARAGFVGSPVGSSLAVGL